MGGINMPIVKNLIIGLFNKPFLNKAGKENGPQFDDQKVVAGNTIPEVVYTIERLNNRGITVTVDCLGEFVLNEGEAIQAKDQILEVMYAINNHNLDGHMSIKISQLG